MKQETTGIPVTKERLLEIADIWEQKAIDKPLVANFGCGTNFLTRFRAEKEAAKGIKTDEQITEELAATTKQKNMKLSECYLWMSGAHDFYFKIVKKGSPEAGLFPTDYARTKTNESLMIITIPNVATLLENNKAKLTEKDMPENFITNGQTLCEELTVLNKTQENLKDLGPEYTIKRHIAFSKLYNSINEIRRAGLLAYKNDPTMVKYFDSPWPAGSPEKIPETAPAPVQNPS